MKVHLVTVTSLVLLLLAALGCTRNDVTAGDLPGTWVLTDASRPSLPPALRSATAKIVLGEDGGFVASELPGEVLFVKPESRGRLITGRGVWKLESQAGTQVLRLEFRSIVDSQPHEVPFGTDMHLSRDATEPILFYFQGDPDRASRLTTLPAYLRLRRAEPADDRELHRWLRHELSVRWWSRLVRVDDSTGGILTNTYDALDRPTAW